MAIKNARENRGGRMTKLILEALGYVGVFYLAVIFVAFSDRQFYKAWKERRINRGRE